MRSRPGGRAAAAGGRAAMADGASCMPGDRQPGSVGQCAEHSGCYSYQAGCSSMYVCGRRGHSARALLRPGRFAYTYHFQHRQQLLVAVVRKGQVQGRRWQGRIGTTGPGQAANEQHTQGGGTPMSHLRKRQRRRPVQQCQRHGGLRQRDAACSQPDRQAQPTCRSASRTDDRASSCTLSSMRTTPGLPGGASSADQGGTPPKWAGEGATKGKNTGARGPAPCGRTCKRLRQLCAAVA